MGKTGKNFFTSVVCSAILLAASAAAQAQSLKGYWKGDDGNPTPGGAVDTTGTWANGTYVAPATTSTTKAPVTFANPTSMSFTAGGGYVSIPSFSWPTGGPVSVAYWGYVTTAQLSNGALFSAGNLEAPNRFLIHGPWGADGKLYWDYGDWQVAAGRISFDYSPHLNKWVHVTCVSAGNGGSYKAIYFNGVRVIEDTGPSDGPKVALSGLDIGRFQLDGMEHQGLVDDFRIYDYVLTQAEITALATAAVTPATPGGLTATPGLTTMQLDWNADATALSFNLGWSLTNGGSYTYVNVATNTYTFTGLPNGTTYFYVVNAVNNAGQSANSSQISATTLTPPPPPPRTQKLGSRHMCGASSIGSGDLLWGAILVALVALALYRTRPSANLR